MALDMSSFAAALKQHYVDLVVKNLVYKNNPLHAILPKDEKFGGLNLPLPQIYGNPQGRSATFSNALAQKTNTQIKAFTLTRVQDYSLANISNEVLEASQGDSDAFMRAATTEIDGAFQACVRSLAGAEYRDGSGSIGVIGSILGATITLATVSDVVNFEVGMTLKSSTSPGVGEQAGSIVLIGVNRSTGVLTASGNITAGIPTAAATQSLHVAGDFNKKITGLDGWVPVTTPTSTAFFGVDRTSDVTRLGGQRIDISALPIEEGLVELSALIAREGGTPDYDFMNFANYANLEKALGSKVMYVDVKSDDGIVGFSGIKIHGQKGMISVIPDQNCQSNRTYMLQMDTWKLYSLGMAPKLLKSDGMEFLRVSSEDSVEVRVGYYAQMGTVAVGWNGVGQLS